MTGQMEQVESTQAAVAAAPAQQFDVAPSNTEFRNANSNATDRAQNTIDQKFGTPEIESANDANAIGSKSKPEQLLLEPDQLMEAAQQGRLGETLTNQGVDISNDKSVQDYLEKSYDKSIENGLRLSGVQLPNNPTAEDLGKALIDKVQGAQNHDLKAALEADPAQGYKWMRSVYIDAQNKALSDEKQRRGH